MKTAFACVAVLVACLPHVVRAEMPLYNAVARADVRPHAPFDDRPVYFLYGHQFGLYPSLHGGQVRHGGTPLASVPARQREAARRDTVRSLRGAPAGSLVAIDYEDWPPVLPADGPYRDLALRQVAEAYPWLVTFDAGRQLAPMTDYLWRARAKAFYLATLDGARAARPDLKYGYYYPQSRHYWHRAYDTPGGDASRAENDVLTDVWASVDWYSASLYWPYAVVADDTHPVPPGHAHERDLRRYVRNNLAEWQRLRGGAMDKPVIAIVEPSVHVGNSVLAGRPLSEYDWRTLMGESRDAGADGVMVWGVAGLTGLDARGHAEAARLYGRVYADVMASTGEADAD